MSNAQRYCLKRYQSSNRARRWTQGICLLRTQRLNTVQQLLLVDPTKWQVSSSTPAHTWYRRQKWHCQQDASNYCAKRVRSPPDTGIFSNAWSVKCLRATCPSVLAIIGTSCTSRANIGCGWRWKRQCWAGWGKSTLRVFRNWEKSGSWSCRSSSCPSVRVYAGH